MKKGKSIARETTVGVADFKARCLDLLDGVGARGERLVITKHGKPIASVTPISRTHKPLKGLLHGQFVIKGDIVHADMADLWEAAR